MGNISFVLTDNQPSEVHSADSSFCGLWLPRQVSFQSLCSDADWICPTCAALVSVWDLGKVYPLSQFSKFLVC